MANFRPLWRSKVMISRATAACLFIASWIAPSAFALAADEPVFSGPQAGERLPPFEATGVFGEWTDKKLDMVADAKHGPLVLVFVHEANRPSISRVRALMTYAESRESDDLSRGVVWLADDATAAVQDLKRMRHALPVTSPLGISVDGAEGPGAYGLNRAMTLTILVANHDRVTANFALVQPSLQADLPKVAQAIIDLIGGERPTVESLAGMSGAREMTAPAKRGGDARLRELMQALIRRAASDEEIATAAAEIDAYIATKPAAKTELLRACKTIVDSGKIANYGAPAAQAKIRAWAANEPSLDGADKKGR